MKKGKKDIMSLAFEDFWGKPSKTTSKHKDMSSEAFDVFWGRCVQAAPPKPFLLRKQLPQIQQIQRKPFRIERSRSFAPQRQQTFRPISSRIQLIRARANESLSRAKESQIRSRMQLERVKAGIPTYTSYEDYVLGARRYIPGTNIETRSGGIVGYSRGTAETAIKTEKFVEQKVKTGISAGIAALKAYREKKENERIDRELAAKKKKGIYN